MLWIVAASDPDGGSPDIGQLVQYGVLGVVLVLLLTGVLVTKGSYEQMRKERDEWKGAYDKEHEAHTTTRDALAESTKAAAASLEVARTTTALLTNLGHVAHRPEPV